MPVANPTTKTEKLCSQCLRWKPMADYAPSRFVKSGRTSICRPCDALKQQAYREKIGPENINDRRKAAYQAPIRRTGETREEFIRSLTLDKYSLSPADFHAMLTQQSNCCAICNEAFDLSDGYKNCHIDHVKHPLDAKNKSYGKVRGLLCNSCNNGIGRFRHDAERLRNAADYLEWHNADRGNKAELGLQCSSDDKPVPFK